MSTICAACGAAVADGDLFCNECGARVELIPDLESVMAETHMTDASKCPKCGAYLADGDLFCNGCGARVELITELETVVAETHMTDVSKCPKCDAYLADGDLFCNECGARVEASASPAHVFCEQCGAMLADDDAFCQECGTRVQLRSTSLAPQSTHVALPTAVSGRETPSITKNDILGYAIYCITIIAIFALMGYVSHRPTMRYRVAATSLLSHQSAAPSPTHSPAPRQTPVPTPPLNTRPSPMPPDPAQYKYVPCSGYVQVDTKDGSLLNIRPAPGAIDPIVFQVPDNSKLHVDGWAWDEIRGNVGYWLRVVDLGGYVLGWVSHEFCDGSNVDFNGTRPFASNWTSTQSRSGSNVARKRDPASYPAMYASGHITVTASNHDLNVRPAPGVVDDVVFIITDKNGCKVNGWSYDQFDHTSNSVWLRLTDNHDNVLGWVNANYCDTTHVIRSEMSASQAGQMAEHNETMLGITQDDIQQVAPNVGVIDTKALLNVFDRIQLGKSFGSAVSSIGRPHSGPLEFTKTADLYSWQLKNVGGYLGIANESGKIISVLFIFENGKKGFSRATFNKIAMAFMEVYGRPNSHIEDERYTWKLSGNRILILRSDDYKDTTFSIWMYFEE